MSQRIEFVERISMCRGGVNECHVYDTHAIINCENNFRIFEDYRKLEKVIFEPTKEKKRKFCRGGPSVIVSEGEVRFLLFENGRNQIAQLDLKNLKVLHETDVDNHVCTSMEKLSKYPNWVALGYRHVAIFDWKKRKIVRDIVCGENNSFLIWSLHQSKFNTHRLYIGLKKKIFECDLSKEDRPFLRDFGDEIHMGSVYNMITILRNSERHLVSNCYCKIVLWKILEDSDPEPIRVFSIDKEKREPSIFGIVEYHKDMLLLGDEWRSVYSLDLNSGEKRKVYEEKDFMPAFGGGHEDVDQLTNISFVDDKKKDILIFNGEMDTVMFLKVHKSGMDEDEMQRIKFLCDWCLEEENGVEIFEIRSNDFGGLKNMKIVFM